MTARVRVVLAEDSYLVREGVRRILDTDPDIELTSCCMDLEGLLAAVERDRPQVVVTDIRMPPGNADEGIRAAARLRDAHPEVGVVVLSQHDEPEYALRLFEKGSARRAYLLKDSLNDPTHLTGAVREVARGGSVVDPKVVETLDCDGGTAHGHLLIAVQSQKRNQVAVLNRKASATFFPRGRIANQPK